VAGRALGIAAGRERRSRADQRDEAERRILEAAVRLVAERGVERITLADVGEAAGYSRGLPAHYFGSKAGLIVALANRLVGAFGRSLERAENHPPGLERLLGTVAFYLDAAPRDPIHTRALFVLLGEGLSNPLLAEPLAALNARSVRGFEATITAGVAAGEIRSDVDPAAEAVLILAALRGVVSQWLVAPAAVDLPAIRDALVQTLERSLTP
jgi:AcrR family transcriptional regulator